MLQQTQVATVIPYYEAFIASFPSVEKLAAAPLDDVLVRWSGLGYYRRARQLHEAAKRVVERGGMPRTAHELEDLPGVGSYTAAAIASIAFGEVVPVLDGNVERVTTRLGAITEDPRKAPVRRQLIETARTLLDPERPGDSNQALMELGATVCRPQRPACLLCPLRPGCKAAVGDPERYPRPRPGREIEHLRLIVALVEHKGRVLCFRRSKDSPLLAGMWELPNVPGAGTLEAAALTLGEVYGGVFHLEPAVGRVRHTVTYRSIELHVHPASFKAGSTLAEGPEAAWVAPDARDRYAFSSVVGKILERFGSEGFKSAARARSRSRPKR